MFESELSDFIPLSSSGSVGLVATLLKTTKFGAQKAYSDVGDNVVLVIVLGCW